MSLQGIVSATFSETVLYVSIVQHNVLLLFVYCLCIEQKYIFIENLASSSPTLYQRIPDVEFTRLYHHVTKLVIPLLPYVTVCDSWSNTSLPLGASRIL